MWFEFESRVCRRTWLSAGSLFRVVVHVGCSEIEQHSLLPTVKASLPVFGLVRTERGVVKPQPLGLPANVVGS